MDRISKRLVGQITARTSEYVLWDSSLVGFGVRVRPSGAKSYVLVYRAGSGRRASSKRITLGKVGKITPDQARQLAAKALGIIAKGGDPAADRASDRAAMTVKELVDAFLAEHVGLKLKPTTASRYRGLLSDWVVPECGTFKANALSAATLAELHAQMKQNPVSANRMLGAVSSMYGLICPL